MVINRQSYCLSIDYFNSCFDHVIRGNLMKAHRGVGRRGGGKGEEFDLIRLITMLKLAHLHNDRLGIDSTGADLHIVAQFEAWPCDGWPHLHTGACGP